MTTREKSGARETVLDFDQEFHDLAPELVLRDLPSGPKQIPSDLEVRPRRLKRSRLIRFLSSEEVVVRKPVAVFGRRDDVDAVIELLNKLEDRVVQLVLARLRDEALTDGVMQIATVAHWNQGVGSCACHGLVPRK